MILPGLGDYAMQRACRISPLSNGFAKNTSMSLVLWESAGVVFGQRSKHGPLAGVVSRRRQRQPALRNRQFVAVSRNLKRGLFLPKVTTVKLAEAASRPWCAMRNWCTF